MAVKSGGSRPGRGGGVNRFGSEGGSITPPAEVAPVVATATVNAAGTSLTIVLTRNVSFGAGGNGGFLLNPTGADVTLVYASGTGTNTLVYTISRAIINTETAVLNYTQPGDGVEAVDGLDLATFTNHAVVNNSTQEQEDLEGTPVDLVVALNTGVSGELVNMAVLDAATHGAAGHWAPQIAPPNHTRYVTEPTGFPAPVLCDGVAYTGASRMIKIDMAEGVINGTTPIYDRINRYFDDTVTFTEISAIMMAKFDMPSGNSIGLVGLDSNASFTVHSDGGGTFFLTEGTNPDASTDFGPYAGPLVPGRLYACCTRKRSSTSKVEVLVIDTTDGSLVGYSRGNSQPGGLGSFALSDYLVFVGGWMKIGAIAFAFNEKADFPLGISSFVIPAPTPVVASLSGADSITVEWAAIAALDYKIERRVNGGSWATVNANYSGASYDDTDVVVDSDYQYRVTAQINEHSSSATTSNSVTMADAAWQYVILPVATTDDGVEAADIALTTVIVAGTTGYVSQIGLYIGLESDAPAVDLGLYNDSNVLLGHAKRVSTSVRLQDAWINVLLSTPISVVNGTTYHIGILRNSGDVNMRYASTGSAQYTNAQSYAAGLPNPYVEDGTNGRAYAARMLITPGAPPPDVTPPTLVSSTVNALGTTLTRVFSEAVTSGANGASSGFAISTSGAAVVGTYASGSGTNTLVYNLDATVLFGDVLTDAYTQPGAGIKDPSGNLLANYSGTSITNNSTEEGALSGLLARWNFEETSGSTAADASGNGHTLTANSPPTWAEPGIGLFSNFLAASDIADMGASAYTISFKIDVATSSDLCPFSKGRYQTNGYYAVITGTGLIVFGTNQSGAIQTTATADGALLPFTGMHRVTFVRSGASVLIYLNGVDVTATPESHVNPTNSSDPFRIGVYGDGATLFADSTFQDFRIYSRALSPAEVASIP